MKKAIWNPTSEHLASSQLSEYANWLSDQGYGSFKDYASLWAWSVEDIARFWQTVGTYFNIEADYSRVLDEPSMPGAEWFPTTRLNYADYIFRSAREDIPAVYYATEITEVSEMSWAELRQRTAAMQSYLISCGVGKGDVVAAYIANIPEATIAWLATISLGAIWTSCSPDFGVSSVVERFQQVAPKVLVTVNGYTYGGKGYDRTAQLRQIIAQLDSLQSVIEIPFLSGGNNLEDISVRVDWATAQKNINASLVYESVSWDHPMCVLYSSGTTGQPKAITHCHGGLLIEHFKYLAFHNDVRPGERFFWYSTTGWMMWNYVQGALLLGASIVLYDGSPAYPSLDRLWRWAQEIGIHHFGTSAPYLVACMKEDIQPHRDYPLPQLRSIGSTGSPLPPEAYDYVYESIHPSVWLTSMSGGTDVCTAFVGGCPWRPVYPGQIQCRALGVDLHAYDLEGNPVINQLGEMVILQAMPSMPIYFWGDEKYRRYISSYFDMYPGIWRHGDWIEIDDSGQLIIHGRSDATLNRQGVRIGTAEIYRALQAISEIKDSLIVSLEQPGGDHFMPLFVQMQSDAPLTDEIRSSIKKILRTTYSPRHVPDQIIAVVDIPYTISGKKMETPIKRILMGGDIDQVINRDAMRNPDSVSEYIHLRDTLLDTPG